MTDRDRLSPLTPEWNALADRQGSPLLRFEWFAEAAEAFSAGQPLSVHVVRDSHRVRAIAPLVQGRHARMGGLQLLGAENYEPENFLWDDEDALAFLCSSLARLRRPSVLFRLPSGSPELAGLRRAFQGRGKAVVRSGSSRAYCNPIAPDWASMEAAIPAKKRRELDRRRRKLEEAGALTFEVQSPCPNGVSEPFESFVRLEGSGWKARNGTAIAQKPDAHSFYLSYGRTIAAFGMLRFAWLRLDGEPIAGQYLVQHAGRLWALKIAYDERYAALSPGALLTHHVLRWASCEGLTGFEHLGVAEDWQRRWPVEEREYSTLRFYPFSARGGGSLALDGLEHLGRKLRRGGGGSVSVAVASDVPRPAAA